eukprot:TRINITY_DN19405_c0_g1_i1.p1 TRINITY_DN19405_c0_g1~~TRINITY_DN19405_c0_g1_i1.p1  ORF type:complete len:1390 (+),score=491.81 TRINITY_DN19405_c0_g1_i1:73-4170(+)
MPHLVVRCAGARKLVCKQKIGVSDPYCVVEVQEGSAKPQKHSTVVRSNTLEPVWDEEFCFESVDLDHASLTVEVLNRNRLRKDNHMGSVTVQLKDVHTSLAQGGEHSEWYTLTKHGETRGECHIIIKGSDFLAQSGAAAAPPPPAASEEAKARRKKEDIFRDAQESLKAALSVRAMTQKDFDIALRRLHGELIGPSPLPESMQWLNTMLVALWPHINEYTKEIMKSTVEPAIHEAVGSTNFSFTRISLGDSPPSLGPIKTDRCEGGLEMHIGITYHSEVDVLLKMPLCSVGVRDVRFVGTLSVFLRPLLCEPPFIGGVEICFVNPPQIDLDFLGVGNVADMPGVAGKIRSAIDQGVAGACVLPNRIAVPLAPLSPEVDLAVMRCPRPSGVLRITVRSASNLEAADTGIGGKSSDPYVRVRVGATTWKGPVVKKTLNPEWKQKNTATFIVYSKEQFVEFDVFDWDSASVDDHLGGVRSMPVEWLTQQPSCVELQLTRPGAVLEGRLRIEYQWMMLEEVPEIGCDGEPHSGCLAAIKVDEVQGMPGDVFKDPFRIRVRATGAGGAAMLEGEHVVGPGTADPAESAGGGEAAMEQVRKLAVSGQSTESIAETVDLDQDLVKECLAVGSDVKKQQAWTVKATACLQKRMAARNPHFHNIGYHVMPGEGGFVELELIDSEDTVIARIKRSVAAAPGVPALDAGPFQFKLHGGQHAELTASIRLYLLRPVPARAAAAPAAAEAAGVEAGGGEAQEDDAEIVAVSCEKEQALMRCLRKNGLSQGDYVTLLQKLRGKDTEAAGLAETLEWINKTLAVLWPNISAFVKHTCTETVQPIIQSSVPVVGSSIVFERCSLGDKPLALGPIAVRSIGESTQWEDDDGLEISLGIKFDSTVDIKIDSSVASVGVKDVKFFGTATVILRAFHSQPPFVGGLEVCFANPPELDMDLLGVGNIAELPGINGIVRGAIDSIIAGQVVMPNRIGVSLNREVISQAALSFPQPEGVARITLIKAQDLMAADTMGGSDPYVVTHLGAREWKGPVVKSTCNPVWEKDNVRDFIVHSKTQMARFCVYDYDTVGTDDSLGQVKGAEVRRLLTEDAVTLPLVSHMGEPAQGTLTVACKWLDLTISPSQGPAGCMFNVQVDFIAGIPEDLQKQSPYILRASVGEVTEQTRACVSNPDDPVDPDKLRLTIRRLLEKKTPHKEIAKSMDLTEELVRKCEELDGEGGKLFRQPASRLEEDLAYVLAMKERGVPKLDQAEKALRDEIAGVSDMAKRSKAWEAAAVESAQAAMASRNPHFHQVLYLLTPPGVDSVQLQLLNAKNETVLAEGTCKLGGHVDPAAGGAMKVSNPKLESKGGAPVTLQGSVVLRGLKAV